MQTVAGTPAADFAALVVVLTGSLGFGFSAWQRDFALMAACAAFAKVGLYCLYTRRFPFLRQLV